jgi:hypothetical protein
MRPSWAEDQLHRPLHGLREIRSTFGVTVAVVDVGSMTVNSNKYYVQNW